MILFIQIINYTNLLKKFKIAFLKRQKLLEFNLKVRIIITI